MGRGLSELQKAILVIGHEIRGHGEDPHYTSHAQWVGSIDVNARVVLKKYFGWGFEETEWGLIKPGERSCCSIDEFTGKLTQRKCDYRKRWFQNWKRGCWVRFSPKAVGEQRYNAAMASIARAMKRLEERGFVTRMGRDWHRTAGCKLTPWGMYQAYRLRSGRKVNRLTVSRNHFRETSELQEQLWSEWRRDGLKQLGWKL